MKVFKDGQERSVAALEVLPPYFPSVLSGYGMELRPLQFEDIKGSAQLLYNVIGKDTEIWEHLNEKQPRDQREMLKKLENHLELIQSGCMAEYVIYGGEKTVGLIRVHTGKYLSPEMARVVFEAYQTPRDCKPAFPLPRDKFTEPYVFPPRVPPSSEPPIVQSFQKGHVMVAKTAYVGTLIGEEFQGTNANSVAKFLFFDHLFSGISEVNARIGDGNGRSLGAMRKLTGMTHYFDYELLKLSAEGEVVSARNTTIWEITAAKWHHPGSGLRALLKRAIEHPQEKVFPSGPKLPDREPTPVPRIVPWLTQIDLGLKPPDSPFAQSQGDGGLC